MRRLLPIIVLAFSVTPLALPQDADLNHPGLTGTWALDVAKSRFKNGARPSPQVEITSAADSVAIAETFWGRKITSVYIPNGKPTPLAPIADGEIFAKAYWQNGSLFTEVVGLQDAFDHAMHPAGKLRQNQRWSLSTDGKTLTREIKAADRTSILVYDKQ